MKKIFKKINLEYFLLGIILVFAFFLRIFRLGVPSFWIDESTSAMASLNILEKGIPVFDSGLLYSRAYLFHYLQSFFLLFGQTEFLARFVSVIFGLLIIFLAYKIGKEYSKSGGIICALFMSVFYLEVFFSRQARFYQLFQLAFIASLYFLYKSRDNPKWLYLSLIAFFITIDTQIAGLVLAPFFILHILFYSKTWRKFLSILPGVSLLYKFLPAKNLSSDSAVSAVSYFRKYAGQASNMIYVLVLFIPGVVWGFIKKKRLTFLLVAPCVVLLIGVFTLKTFALRYAYFFVFPLVFYSSLFISFLYEKYGKIMLIAIFIILIIPSNLIFPHTYVNMIKPVDYNYNDYSAPEINFKDIPQELISEMKGEILISYFSSNVEWYIKKPDYVIPFSMNGIGEDQISMNCSDFVCDRYSGARILDEDVESYYLVADYYSLGKLKENQRQRHEELIEGCSLQYENENLKIWDCLK